MVQQRVQQPSSGALGLAQGSTEAGAAQQQQQQGAAGPAAAAQEQQGSGQARLFEFGPGCIAGAVDFYLKRCGRGLLGLGGALNLEQPCTPLPCKASLATGHAAWDL